MNLPAHLLEKAALAEKLAHCLLLHGGSRQERREVGRRLAFILNCQGLNARPCLVCNSCRKIASGNHPDVGVLEPQKDSLRIEQVLAWQEQVYRKHYEGRYKVFFLEQAETLTEPASNALLKVIEEPPERTLIILSAQNAEGILPTIRSRVQMVFFPDLSTESWQEQHTETESGQAAEAFGLSGGVPDLATRILEMGVSPIQLWVRQFWQAVEMQDFLLVFPLFAKDQKIERNHIAVYLQVLGQEIQKGICDNRMSPAALIALNEALEALRQNGTPRLVVEVLALKLFSEAKRFDLTG